MSDPAHVAFVGGRDGTDGFYQFVVDQPGTYTITVTPPPGYIVNQRDCAASGTLIADGTSTPLILGSNEDGATGYLADSSCSANQWYLVLDIQDTTPLFVNNNIPLLSRGSIPALNGWGIGITTSLLALAALAIMRRRSGV